MRKPMEPNFLIIGAQKSGTTALHDVLIQHPEITSARKKEVHYFDDDEWYGKGNIHDYHDQFSLTAWSSKPSHVFEATPMYIYHPLVAERLYRYNPSLKLIAILREPAARALSSWNMFHHNFNRPDRASLRDLRSFEECVKNDLNNLNKLSLKEDTRSYVRRGFYAEQLERYFTFFNRNQVLVLEHSSFRSEFDSTMATILDFLDIDYFPFQVIESNRSKVSNKEEHLDTLKELRAFYKPHNERLFNLIGKRFEWG